MGSSYISDDATILTSTTCIHDSNIAYFADFSVNGEVDGWEYYDGIHTYGVWGGFLFGTLYDTYGTIGRYNVFRAVDASTHYTLKIVMKYNPKTRTGDHALPTQGKVRWRTLSNTQWDSVKEKDFTIYADNLWHTYSLNMGTEQYWQGDVNDLRIWVAKENGEDGDEFFIRVIEISSVESHACLNTNCDKYSWYEHPCPWIGERGYCQSAANSRSLFSIAEDSEFIVNINDYGNEIVKTKEVLNGSGQAVANALARAISRVDIGGYAETQIVYTDDNEFRIYSGTTSAASSVVVVDNDLARYLNFFNTPGDDVSSKTTGELPASGYSPLSSFKVRTSQVLDLFDNNEETNLNFNPFGYSVTGGRQDWMGSGPGELIASIGENDGDESGQVIRDYYLISNGNRTIIDFNHPFNASGRITKIYIACTLDMDTTKAKLESTRKSSELSGAKAMIFRPKRDGTLDVIHEFDITDRDPTRGYNDALYSLTQEVVELDVDVFVNKGDFLGIYHANLYVGRSISGNEIDAQFFQVTGKPSSNFLPGRLNGDGAGGILMYARGNDPQLRLVLDIDLKNRYNLEKIEIKGLPRATILEYNIARCLDIDWKVDLFGDYHWTAHKILGVPDTYTYQRYNVAYGIDNLSDGITIVPDGLACDSYTITTDQGSAGVNYNAGPGIVPTNPHYFWVNGDEEWLSVWLHAKPSHKDQAVYDFDSDPIAMYIHFPFGKEKTIYKSVIYFKEKYNFRSFSLSTYRGVYDYLGNADDTHYDLIPSYTAVVLDNTRYDTSSSLYTQVDEYLFKNPSVGKAITEATSEATYEWDPILSDVIRDFGGSSGYFVYQTAKVVNADEWEQSRRTDWQTLQHEWEPITCKGFRIYTDFHKSTKICEMELYGVAQDIGSAFAGGIDITYSNYSEAWWPTTSVQQNDTLVEVYVGDTPRYLTVELIPIVETRYDDIVLNVKTEDIYAGSKGCEYSYYLEHSKLGASNKSQVINLKNTYQNPYDLYVDIAPDQRIEDGLIFYSKLDSADAIDNPEVGPDARYYKLFDYVIENDDYNCAINCNVYGLKNLIDGKTAYYSKDEGYTWSEYGTLAHGVDVGFTNVSTGVRSIIDVPVISRNRYWKLSFSCGDAVMNVREMRVYYQDEELDAVFYHDLSLSKYAGPISDRAPHLNNDSITGSYYTIEGDDRISFDLGAQKAIDKIVLFHDDLEEYDNYFCDIDLGLWLYLNGSTTDYDDDIIDHSYFQNTVEVVGSVYGDPAKPQIADNSLYFGDKDNDYLIVGRNYGLNVHIWYFSIDLFVYFEELPSSGETAYFMRNTSARHAFYLENDGSDIYLKMQYGVGKLKSYKWNAVTTGTWYHIAFARGARDYGGTGETEFFINNSPKTASSASPGADCGWYDEDLIVGDGFKGWISNLRIHSGPDKYGTAAVRIWSNPKSFPVPTEWATKRFKMQLYASDNNIHFGDYATLDLYRDGPDPIYREPTSIFSGKYNDYLAIDLGKSYNLDIIRSYGDSDKHDFSDVDYIAYSSSDTSDINSVVFSNYASLDDDFSSSPNEDLWSTIDGEIVNNKFRISTTSANNDWSGVIASYKIMGDFYCQVDFNIISSQSTEGWSFGLVFDDTAGASVRALRKFTSSKNDHYASEDESSVRKTYSTSDISSTLRVQRSGDLFELSFKDAGTWKVLERRVVSDLDVSLQIRLYNWTNYPDVTVDVSNFVMHYGIPSKPIDKSDARWIRINLPNGGGTSLVIRKIGVYPDITESLTPDRDSYNCEWNTLGSSITAYSTGTNVALGATVSGSSYIGEYIPDNTVNGIIDNEFSNVWGTDDSSEQWLELDLGEEKQIYRIKLYHGYSEDDSDFMIEDYRLETSTDNISYTTIFTITNNSSFERTHDLAQPVTARYVRLYVTDYAASWRYVRVGTTYERFEGAVLREIEIYDYYGYSSVSSEDYPIIALDLRDQFYIESHSMIGIDSESTSDDWDNSDASYAYSDAVLTEPQKVTFSSFGSAPNYEQWVAVKRDTATNYNSGPDYLKHVLIGSADKANPTDYWWWWQSNVSTLSSDYDRHVELCERSLKIDYPASSVLEDISFRKGTDFGVDSDMSLRDGVAFRLYIEDVDKLDTSEGYFYFGGLDGTDNPKPIEYRWYLDTLSGTAALQTGWNRPYFNFRAADETVYTEASDPTDEIQPLMMEYVTMDTIGLKFKGIGQPVTLNLDGFLIQRNHFNDYSKFGQGLYLTGTDYLTCPLGEIDFTGGTIEFWLRPDYTFAGLDEFGRFKNRSIFHFGTVINDVFGMTITSYGVVIYFGNMADDLAAFVVSGITASAIDNLFHFGIVFSNNGQRMGADNSTIRLYINNFLMGTNYQTWDILDSKSFKFTFGGKSPLGLIEQAGSLDTSSVDGVLSNLRIYNYCKTDFTDSLQNIPDKQRVGNLTSPSKFIEISSDNVTFYRVGAPQLPFLIEKVPAGTVVPIYIRSIVPATLTGYESRTSGIVASWDVGV